MARYKPQEIVRRDAIPARRAERPILAVHADQEPTRYAGSLVRVVGGGIQMLGDIYSQRMAQKNAKQAEEDFNRGADMRRKEALSGEQDHFREHILAVASEHYKRGYYKTDGMLKIRNWTAETAPQLAQAEPDADYAELVQASKTGLLQHPAFQDPQTRQDMLALLDKADHALYALHLEGSVKEMIARQQESLTANIRAELAAGVPLVEMAKRMRELTHTAEFGYLHQREADALTIKAVADVLATGEVDIEATLEALEAVKDEQGVSWLDGTHGDDIRKAAATGAARQEAQRAQARKEAQVLLERPLRELARQGRLSDDNIFEAAAQLGLSGQERLAFIRRWMDKQEQGVKANQADAEKRRKEREADALARRNPLWLSDADARKALDRQLLDASGGDSNAVIEAIRGNTPQARDVLDVLDTAVRWNIVPTVVTSMLQRGGYTDADAFAGQSELYQQLRTRSPAFANKAAGSKAAIFDDYQVTVVEGGHDDRAFLDRLGTTKRAADEAAYAVNAALKNARKEYATITLDGDEVPRPEGDWWGIRRRADEIAAEHPGVSPESAIKAAVEEWDGGFTTLNGRRVPNQSIPPHAQEGVEAFIGGIASRLKLDEGALTAYPSLDNPERWLVLGEDGFPISDPDTGNQVGFNPQRVGAMYTDWKQQLEAVRVRDKALKEQMKRLEESQWVPRKAPGGRPIPHVRDFVSKQTEIEALTASPDYQQMLRNRTLRNRVADDIPVNFMVYLATHKEPPTPQDE